MRVAGSENFLKLDSRAFIPSFLFCPYCCWSATDIANWKPEKCPACKYERVSCLPVQGLGKQVRLARIEEQLA